MLVRIWRDKKPSESISQNEGAPQAGNSSQPRKKLGQVGEPAFPAGADARSPKDREWLAVR
jgi:hypothetical protein